jgi:hypothetical protein
MSIETVEFSLICLEDLDIGTGTRSVHLADGSTVTLHQIPLESLGSPGSPGSLFALVTRRIVLGAGAALVTLGAVIPAGARVMGVTTEIVTSLGTTQGVSAFAIGDATAMDRWGIQDVLSQGAQTDQGDFHGSDLPIYPTASDVVLSAIGGLFDGTGEVEVSVHYLLLPHRSA